MDKTVLVMGSNGMLGHKLMQVASKNFNTYGTIRGQSDNDRTIGFVSADNMESVRKAMKLVLPDVVVNCIGIVKQSSNANDPLSAISINALFPHKLARVCKQNNVRLIHISTDCVFSGSSGYYFEDSLSDAIDMYGRTKYLGEVSYPNCLTLRTSMIGRELGTSNGLVEWFIKNNHCMVNGYTNSIFSGLTTLELSKVITNIIAKYPQLEGVYNVASHPISKYYLLEFIKRIYELDITIVPDPSVECDRSLNSLRFFHDTNIPIPSWETMIERMHADVI